MAEGGGVGSVEEARDQLAVLFSHVPRQVIEDTLAAIQNAMGPPQHNYFINLVNQCVDKLVNEEVPDVPQGAGPSGSGNDGVDAAGEPGTSATPELALKPQEIKEWIMDMHPRVDPKWVDSKIAEGYSVKKLANFMMDPKNHWPKLERKKVKDARKAPEEAQRKPVCYWTEYADPVSMQYRLAAEKLLAADFRWINLASVRKVMKVYNFHYAPTKKCLSETLTEVTDATPSQLLSIKCNQLPGTGPAKTLQVRIMKKIRSPHRPGARQEEVIGLIPEELREEMDFVRRQEEDKMTATIQGVIGDLTGSPSSMIQLEAGDAGVGGDLFECQICFEESSLGGCVSCENAHVFCASCVVNHAKQVAYGQGRPRVDCLETDCEAGFPQNLLEKILDVEVLRRLEERLREENLNAAEIEGLERCKYCEWAVVMEAAVDVDKVFRCGNEECGAEVCRECGLDWDEDHLGVPCKEMERDEAVHARREYEEKMTKEVIRYCPKCKIPITKVEGCNKMTCRCGQKMCYLCRTKGIDYSHFCQHPLTPGKPCDKCQKCLLWEDDKKFDLHKLKDIEKEALQDQRIDEQHAGALKVPDAASPKRQKMNGAAPPAPAPANNNNPVPARRQVHDGNQGGGGAGVAAGPAPPNFPNPQQAAIQPPQHQPVNGGNPAPLNYPHGQPGGGGQWAQWGGNFVRGGFQAHPNQPAGPLGIIRYNPGVPPPAFGVQAQGQGGGGAMGYPVMAGPQGALQNFNGALNQWQYPLGQQQPGNNQGMFQQAPHQLLLNFD